MINRVHLQPAYILHYRPYRDTSLIVDIFSEEYGYLSAIAQGARSARSMLKGLLQPFIPLFISWSGKSELVRINQVEAKGLAYILQGDYLISAMYINELLLRSLHKHDPHPELFHFYDQVLAALNLSHSVQPILRQFEKNLLHELGYAVVLDCCYRTGKPVETDKYYQFNPAQGLIELTPEQLAVTTKNVFSGKSIIALANDQLAERQALRDAKQLMRLALAQVIGDKPLKSRELFLGRQKNGSEDH